MSAGRGRFGRLAVSSALDGGRGRRHRTVPRLLGILLGVNFLLVWLLPVVAQGQAFRLGLSRVVRPVHDALDRSPAVRRFAARYVYRRPVHTDYFATAALFLIGFGASLAFVFGWQIAHGRLHWWVVAAYYFAWVGFGGRAMAAAYTFAHREGHARGRMYRPWLQGSAGNLFEDRIGPFYGNVPHNFSTSHILLHHRLQAGRGDPMYLWDLDRTRFGDLMAYHWRVFVYMTGWSSWVAFGRYAEPRMRAARRRLARGMVTYWFLLPGTIAAALVATGSGLAATFVFIALIYLQPLAAMAAFLTVVNVGFHGFFEVDGAGRPVRGVCSTTILDGPDDSFGEDDHMAHHHFTTVTHRELPAHQRSQHAVWAEQGASVFRNLSAFELGGCIMLRRFRRLAALYVDAAGDRSQDEVARLLRIRAARTEAA